MGCTVADSHRLLSPLPSSHCDLKSSLELLAVLISAPVFMSCSLFSYYTCPVIVLSDLQFARHLLQGSAAALLVVVKTIGAWQNPLGIMIFRVQRCRRRAKHISQDNRLHVWQWCFFRSAVGVSLSRAVIFLIVLTWLPQYS